ncbi:uncharacterized protein LOC129968436 [Argiope bruennichi]|uniref:uncharacterized protein LOC129968436 n=1 Tax=Argiope bruennichi TaxID=94029 RepID=UPI002494D303|nr:uncharacterized protein LOC129968436 [Argiope bruennichi]
MGTFFSWNCRGIRSKLSDIKTILNKFHPICLGIQETFLTPSIPIKLRGYNCTRKDTDTGSRSSGGVCLLTSNLYPSTPLTLHTPLQAVAVQVHTRTLVTVCSIYLPPHDVINQQHLDNLVDQLPRPLIILGDFNEHSVWWGSESTNSRGRQIEKFISNNCLCILNNDEKTYFHEPTHRFHSVDLAICSPELMPLLNFARADWDAFSHLAEITEIMVNTNDITDAVQRYPTIENLVAFKKAKALARRIRRRSQRESWIKFVSSITSSTSTKLLWKKVKAANGIYSETSIPVLKTGNLVHSSPLEVANILGHAFAQVSAIDSYSSEFLEIKNLAERLTLHFNDRNTLTYNSEFRMFELKTALSQAGDTSPGPDGITYSMLRHLNETSLSNLLLLFNRIWTEHKYPKQWSEATVIPILKPGKDPLNPLNYRPIALTNCVCKTFERMVNALFTDDSKSDGYVGCAIVTPSNTLSYRLNNVCSVFTAELVAISHALQEISLSTQRSVIIYTDSMSALETLSHFRNHMHPVAFENLFNLRILKSRGFNILLCWVPSHVGISGNEKADVAAKSASTSLSLALPYCDVKKLFIYQLFKTWQKSWDLQIQNKLHLIKPTIGLWPVLPIRENDVKLTRLRIGHTRYTHRR